jgi:hypothetical protein
MMSKRSLALAFMIGLVVLALSAPAMGMTKNKHRCRSAIRSVLIEQGAGFPTSARGRSRQK